MLNIKNLDCFEEIKQGKGMERTEERYEVFDKDGNRVIFWMRTWFHDRKCKRDIMHEYVKRGYINKFINLTVSIEIMTESTDELGGKIWRGGWYNPQVKRGGFGYVIDFDWMLEDTPENRQKLFDEVKRLAENNIRER